MGGNDFLQYLNIFYNILIIRAGNIISGLSNKIYIMENGNLMPVIHC